MVVVLAVKVSARVDKKEAREVEAIMPLSYGRAVEVTGEWPGMVPVPVVQIAPCGGAGLIIGCGRPWDQRCQRPQEERVE